MPFLVNLFGFLVFFFLPAYLVGSIPYGYIIGRLKGVDIRKQGSGNIGATNVWRVLGKGWGMTTFVLDFLKVPLASKCISRLVVPPPPDLLGWALITIFLGAVIGHNFPIWLKFKGGKGIATTAGGLLGLMPHAFLLVLAVWIVVFTVFRYVSLASLAAALVLPPATWFFARGDKVLLGFSCLLAVMAIWRHRSNIQRLLGGTEHKWSRRAKDDETETGGGA